MLRQHYRYIIIYEYYRYRFKSAIKLKDFRIEDVRDSAGQNTIRYMVHTGQKWWITRYTLMIN